LLYLVGVPAVVVALVWALAYRGGPGAEKRYRPSRPYQFSPVWYLAARPEQQRPEQQRPALAAGGQRLALPAPPDRSGQPGQMAVGGASDRW
jgi:hypothetical protein